MPAHGSGVNPSGVGRPGCDAIGNTPGIGHKGEDLTAYRVLFWPVGAYLVIYRATSRPVEIVAVTEGARDIPAFLHHRFS
jgi:plasmid stabilization system protein ParE